MELDKVFVEKIDKLAMLSEKFSKRTQKDTIEKLNQKLLDLKSQRKANAESCVQIISKYHKILDIRLKDTMFQTWLNKLK